MDYLLYMNMTKPVLLLQNDIHLTILLDHLSIMKEKIKFFTDIQH